MTIYVRRSENVGRVVLVRHDDNSLPIKREEVPISMIRSLSEVWSALGWTVIDERDPAPSPLEAAG